MPLCLAQLSRREFLRRAALAGLAAVWTPPVLAELAAKPRDPQAVFFISDVHISENFALVSRGVNMSVNLGRVVKEVLNWPVAPAAIIISGDLAHYHGYPGDYAAFGKLILPLRALAPVHLMLGNHDQRHNFWQAFPEDAARVAAVPEKNVAMFSAAGLNWFLLDSLDITTERTGKLGPEQLAWLTGELALHPDRPAVVVCHHNLDPVVETASLDGNLGVAPMLQHLGVLGGLKDTPSMEQLLIASRQVKAFIYGHTHDWHVSQHEHGVQLINLPPTAYVFETGRPNGWVRANFRAGGADFELRSLDAKHPEHAGVKRLEWRLG
jgi:hypothetical protein